MIKPMRACLPTKPLTNFPYYASPKIDGIRAIVKDGVVLSKSMKPIPNPYIQSKFGKYEGFDGELVVGNPFGSDVFERSRGFIMRKAHDGLEVDIRFYVFDLWNLPNMPFYVRNKEVMLQTIQSGDSNLFLVFHNIAENMTDLNSLLERYLKQGYEGAMLRNPEGWYKYGTSTEKEGYLIKLKPFKDAEAVVIGIEEQYANTNVASKDEMGYTKRSSSKEGMVGKDTFGAFLVRDLETGTEFRVGNGPGLTHEKRDKLWSIKDQLIGKLITYKYQAVGTKDAPRLPQFLRFRDWEDMWND